MSHVQKAAVNFNLVQRATVDVHRDQKATVNAPHVQHTFVDVQNSAVQSHFQSSVVGGPHHEEVALPIFQADVPDLDVSGVNFSNYDPQIIITPGGTILSVL